jgi:hypothetical protein
MLLLLSVGVVVNFNAQPVGWGGDRVDALTATTGRAGLLSLPDSSSSGEYDDA